MTDSVTGVLFNGELNITVTDPNGYNTSFLVNTTGGMFNLSSLDYIFNSSGEYSLVVNFGSDGIHNPSNNIISFGVHPSYDLRLENKGSFSVGSWVDSVATPVGDDPLSMDCAVFKVTNPNGESWSSPHTPFNNNVFTYKWQISMKGEWLVEVWPMTRMVIMLKHHVVVF